MTRPEWLDVKPKGKPQANSFEIADKYVPAFARVILHWAKDLWAGVDKSALIKAIRREDVKEAIAAFPMTGDEPYRLLAMRVQKIYGMTMSEAGQLEWDRLKINGTFVAKADIGVPLNPYSRKYIREQSAKLVVGISKGQRDALRKVLADNFDRAARPEAVLKSIERIVGLTEHQASAPDKRYQSMIAGGADEETAQAGADRYAAQLLTQRAENIARTETTDAQNAGLMDSWRLAQDEGELPKNLKKEWVALDRSERLSDICAELDGQIVDMDEEFHSDVLDEDFDRPPSHTNCRSVLRLLFED